MSGNDETGNSPRLRAHMGWAGTLASVWSLAGGIAGGMLITIFLLAGRLHPEGSVMFAGVLAAVGSVLGIIHGVVLGRISRPGDGTPADQVLSVVVVAGAFVLAIWIGMWLALTAVLARAGSVSGTVALVALIAGALAVVAWATVLGWQAIERAYIRWPDHRIGLRLVIGAFLVLAATALVLRPALPGTELQLSAPALVVGAALAALWIATPAIIVALRFTHPRAKSAQHRSVSRM